LNEVVNCDDHYADTAPVGSLKTNPWGLNDMLGNVTECAEDCYVDNYREAPTDGSPVTTPVCQFGVVRGASFVDIPPA
jgi:formylglycine-generating enzyme required for sulfatase activity